MIIDSDRITIISGGQSGTDRAALDFAINNNIPCGGWCPMGRLAEDGRIDDKYPLKETETAEPNDRTRLNVAESNATLIIYRKNLDKGTKLTIQVAKEMLKPVFIVSKNKGFSVEEFRGWMEVHKIDTLNIAGPRESNDEGVYRYAFEVLESLFE